MNVLPFVAIFLTILATLSYSFLDKSKILLYEKEIALSYMKVERDLLKKLHREAFKKAPIKKISESTPIATAFSVDSKVEVDSSLSPRGDDLSKMNLSPLFTENCPKEIQMICQNLLKILYQHAPFITSSSLDEIFKTLLQSMIKSGKEKIAVCKEKEEEISTLSLSEFYPKNPQEHALFYKMLKGTHMYNLGMEGYPPLQDFFFFEEDKTPQLLHFPSLSPLMLEVVFGREESLAILSKEIEVRTKNPERTLKTLSKEELVSLLHEKFPTKIYFDKLIEHLGFTTKNKTEDIISAFDSKTSIKIERNRS